MAPRYQSSFPGRREEGTSREDLPGRPPPISGSKETEGRRRAESHREQPKPPGLELRSPRATSFSGHQTTTGHRRGKSSSGQDTEQAAERRHPLPTLALRPQKIASHSQAESCAAHPNEQAEGQSSRRASTFSGYQKTPGYRRSEAPPGHHAEQAVERRGPRPSSHSGPQKTQGHRRAVSPTGKRVQQADNQRGLYESIALTEPNLHDPDSTEWDNIQDEDPPDEERVIVFSADDQLNRDAPDDPLSTPETDARTRIMIQMSKVAADIRELTAALAQGSREWFAANNTSESRQALVDRVRYLSTELTQMASTLGLADLPEGLTPLETNLRNIFMNPAEVSYQAFMRIQPIASSAMSGISTFMGRFLTDQPYEEPEFNRYMQRSWWSASHVFEESEQPMFVPTEHIDDDNAWVVVRERNESRTSFLADSYRGSPASSTTYLPGNGVRAEDQKFDRNLGEMDGESRASRQPADIPLPEEDDPLNHALDSKIWQQPRDQWPGQQADENVAEEVVKELVEEAVKADVGSEPAKVLVLRPVKADVVEEAVNELVEKPLEVADGCSDDEGVFEDAVEQQE